MLADNGRFPRSNELEQESGATLYMNTEVLLHIVVIVKNIESKAFLFQIAVQRGDVNTMSYLHQNIEGWPYTERSSRTYGKFCVNYASRRARRL